MSDLDITLAKVRIEDLKNKIGLTEEEYSGMIEPLLNEGNYLGALKDLESLARNYLEYY